MDEIAALLEPEIPRLRRYAYALARDAAAADDLVQDTLERAISRWHLRRRDVPLRAWLFTIERNIFLGHLRQARRRGTHMGADALDNLPAPDTPQDGALAARDVLAALDELPEEQRSVLLLVAVEDLSYDDAARTLDVPVGTIMSRLSRARARLRGLLGAAPVALRRVK